MTVPGHQKVTAQEECRGNKGRISLSTPRLKEAGMNGGMNTSVEVFTCTNADQSAAGRRGVDAAPALSAASQSGLFQRRLFALRQFLKEALNINRAGPAAPKPDVNYAGRHRRRPSLIRAKPHPRIPLASLSVSTRFTDKPNAA